ncbi:MAG: hypothetical protein Q8Q90_02275 [bacterium]|nr:hypothetical protein [bacterium]
MQNWLKENWIIIFVPSVLLLFGLLISYVAKENTQESEDQTLQEYLVQEYGHSPVLDLKEWFLSIRQKDSCLDLLEDLEKKSGRDSGFGGGTAFSDIATKIVHNYNNDQCVQISNKCKGSKNLECAFNIVLSEYIEK